MEERLPFASGAARLWLLYALPMTGEERRIQVAGAAKSVALALPPQREGTVDVLHLKAPDDSLLEAGDCDAVLVPGTLFQGSAKSAEALLQSAFLALAPGGVLVGHCENLLSVHQLRAALRRPKDAVHWANWRAAGSANLLRKTLTRLGYVDAEAFYVEPQIMSPMALIPADPHASQSHFVRTVWRNRSLYGQLGFALRLTLAHAHLGGSLQPHLFFWARKPC